MVSGTKIKKLMRANQATIRGLAAHMSITMVRVRLVRNRGLNDATCGTTSMVGPVMVQGFALDWFEGITGSTEGFGSWLNS